MNDLSSTPVERLSERQKQCLRLVYTRHSSKEIGLQLGLSFDTVDQHVKRAMRILGVSSRGEAARTLVSHEEGHPQLLGTQSEAVALEASADEQPDKIDNHQGFLVRAFDLPPIGGPDNDLTTSRRILAISRVGFFAALLLIATIVTVQGIITLLN
jgi:DNA-binding CsgD family transcriptional regulator